MYRPFQWREHISGHTHMLGLLCQPDAFHWTDVNNWFTVKSEVIIQSIVQSVLSVWLSSTLEIIYQWLPAQVVPQKGLNATPLKKQKFSFEAHCSSLLVCPSESLSPWGTYTSFSRNSCGIPLANPGPARALLLTGAPIGLVHNIHAVNYFAQCHLPSKPLRLL